MSWTPGWHTTGGAAVPGDPQALRSQAEALVLEAGTGEKVEALIGRYEGILQIDPQDCDALSKLGEYHCLLGAAYAKSRTDKSRQFFLAIQFCERAMATNAEFKALVSDGNDVGEACRVLGVREMDAMFFWSMAISYLFKECQSPIGSMVNFSWMKRCRQVMERMLEVDPAWRDGVVSFSWGIYYLALPAAVGGDMKKSSEFLDRAIQAGPKSLLHRWGRAKYYDVKMGDAEAFREDLEWVLAQDPRQSANPTFPWSAYFQRDARAMLERSKKYSLKKAAVT
jgi:tetratricopeptide (TPR) repeat protein